jgi:hypothetical protein
METENEHAPGFAASEWCVYCSTPTGSLQTFEERFERMVQWQMKQEGQDRTIAESSTRTYMRTMPAWKDHPALQEK